MRSETHWPNQKRSAAKVETSCMVASAVIRGRLKTVWQKHDTKKNNPAGLKHFIFVRINWNPLRCAIHAMPIIFAGQRSWTVKFFEKQKQLLPTRHLSAVQSSVEVLTGSQSVCRNVCKMHSATCFLFTKNELKINRATDERKEEERKKNRTNKNQIHYNL